MKAVVQRVAMSRVVVGGELVSEIGAGLLILLGITHDDSEVDVEWLANKIVNLRIFDDESGTMNRSCKEAGKEILTVSQFTLHARTKKGQRPSYVDAATPETALPLYEKFCETIDMLMGKTCGRGRFGANMQIRNICDGPVTIIIDTKNRH